MTQDIPLTATALPGASADERPEPISKDTHSPGCNPRQSPQPGNNPTQDQDVHRKHSLLRDLGYGSLVSLTFFRRNAWLLIAIIVAVVALIGLRYQTKTKMSQIRSLERELVLAESEKLQQKSEYMSLIRETEMQRLVNEHGLGLTFQEQPPYRLTPEE